MLEGEETASNESLLGTNGKVERDIYAMDYLMVLRLCHGEIRQIARQTDRQTL